MYATLHITPDHERIYALHETLREAEEHAADALAELGGVAEIFLRMRMLWPGDELTELPREYALERRVA